MSHFDCLFLGPDFVFPVFSAGKRSICCIGSFITILCGMVCLATCLTGWVYSFWHSFGSVSVSVAVVRIVDVAVRVRGIGIIVFFPGLS